MDYNAFILTGYVWRHYGNRCRDRVARTRDLHPTVDLPDTVRGSTPSKGSAFLFAGQDSKIGRTLIKPATFATTPSEGGCMYWLGQATFWFAYRLSFLVAKWRLAWSYWNVDGKNVATVRWNNDH